MELFDDMKDSHHHCTMDNLYNSTAFCRAAYNHTRKIICQGVTRKGMRDIPPSVLQVEQKPRKYQIKVRGTDRDAILEGDDACPNLVACSIYNTKPVHYLIIVCDTIKWVVMEKPCFNVETGMIETLIFLRMNTIHEYNNTMGGVDLVEQLQGTYRIDEGVRNRKWRWSILFWSIGVMITNAYVIYLHVNLENGI